MPIYAKAQSPRLKSLDMDQEPGIKFGSHNKIERARGRDQLGVSLAIAYFGGNR